MDLYKINRFFKKSHPECGMVSGVSVIVPCYNSGRYLTEAIESVYELKLSIPIEIIIVDDGSDDTETHAVLESLESNYSKKAFRVVYNKENKGAAHSRNLALQQAKYEYIFPLDSDNRLGSIKGQKSYIEQGWETLRSNPNALMVYCKGRTFEAIEGSWNLLPYNEKSLLCNNMLDTHAMYRRSEALAIGGYIAAKGLPEDWVFAVGLHNQRLILGKPVEVHICDEGLFYYRVRADNTNVTSQYSFTQVHPSSVTRSLMIHLYPEIYKKHFPTVKSGKLLSSVENFGIKEQGNHHNIGTLALIKRYLGRTIRHLMHRKKLHPFAFS